MRTNCRTPTSRKRFGTYLLLSQPSEEFRRILSHFDSFDHGIDTLRLITSLRRPETEKNYNQVQIRFFNEITEVSTKVISTDSVMYT